tara:strand:+ start:4045 stop:4218 length:174 start_codon:yes stop_codon:yes gene_type:complete
MKRIKGDKMKVSECCNAKLKYYNKDWDDGICTACEHHSPAAEEDCDVEARTMGTEVD